MKQQIFDGKKIYELKTVIWKLNICVCVNKFKAYVFEIEW